MSRPTVLLLEPDPERRKALSLGLARHAYEVVPTVSVTEGLRFAEGLGPSVVVAPAGLPELADAQLLYRFADTRGLHTLLLLGRPAVPEAELPQAVLLLPDQGLPAEIVARKLQLVLLGREIGVEADERIESLVGDLSLTPPLELVRALAQARFTGRVVMERGELSLDQGRLVAARADGARGLKAFFRLGRRVDGPFRVWLESMVAGGEIDHPLDDLVIQAVEEASVGEYPSPRTRFALVEHAEEAARTGRQREILERAREGATAAELFDAFPATDGALLAEIEDLRREGLLTYEEPLTRVRVVTDSTCDLPAEVTDRLGIEVVPLAVHFGDTRYVDGVTLRPRRFYELLESGENHPFTQPPEAADFGRVYRRVGKEQDVISIHISGVLSETFVHAKEGAEAARAQLPPRRPSGEPLTLDLIDSRFTSLALGLLVVFAARMAQRDLGAREIATRLRSMAERLDALFVVDTLEYLARGGRIGKARAVIGGMLGIKPILGFEDGQVAPVDRVRGGRAAHPRLLDLLAQRMPGKNPVVVGIAHAKAPVWADRLAGLVRERFDCAELQMTEIGPVVGTHGGPGLVGIAMFEPTPEEWELIAPVEERAPTPVGRPPRATMTPSAR